MKKILLLMLSVIIFCCGCNRDELPDGSGDSEITGSIVKFYGDEEAAIDVFYSGNTERKEISLAQGEAYVITLEPSFRGSKQAVYIGDCAEFTFEDGCCEIKYSGNSESQPIYELKIISEKDFLLDIEVDGYKQSINVTVE